MKLHIIIPIDLLFPHTMFGSMVSSDFDTIYADAGLCSKKVFYSDSITVSAEMCQALPIYFFLDPIF